MGTEKFKETRDYLGLWLERSRQVADKASTVYQSYEEVDWVVRTLEHRLSEAAGISTVQLNEYADSLHQRITSELPMLPPVGRIGPTVAATVSSTSVVVLYVMNVACLDTPDTATYASKSLSEYRQLQDSHQRLEQVRTLLETTLPTSVPRFDFAREAYRRYKAGHETESAAAIEMRTFLDSLKGELYARARQAPGENMTLEIVPERLFSSAPTKMEVEQQFALRSSLYDNLSAMAKRRSSSPGFDLDALWARVLDHAFIVANALNLSAS